MTQPPATRRIGLLLPSSNTSQEAEFRRVLPADATLHVALMPLRNEEADSTLRIVGDVESESRNLADADVDVEADVEAIVLAATAQSSRRGPGYDQALIAEPGQPVGRPALGRMPRSRPDRIRSPRWKGPR